MRRAAVLPWAMIHPHSAKVRPSGYSLHPGARGLRARVATSGASVELRRLSLQDGELAFGVGGWPSFREGALFALRVESERWGTVTLRARSRSVRVVAGQATVAFEHSMARREATKLHAILEALREANQAYSSWERQEPSKRSPRPARASSLCSERWCASTTRCVSPPMMARSSLPTA